MTQLLDDTDLRRIEAAIDKMMANAATTMESAARRIREGHIALAEAELAGAAAVLRSPHAWGAWNLEHGTC